MMLFLLMGDSRDSQDVLASDSQHYFLFKILHLLKNKHPKVGQVPVQCVIQLT